MKKETHVIGEIFVHRYVADEPRYALVVSHGIGGHGGVYEKFCAFQAARGADIWSYDAPGHGQSTLNRPRGQWTLEEWCEAGISLADHVKSATHLPVFLLGSSLGVAAAYAGLHSDSVTGGILMGSPAVPSSPIMEGMAPLYRDEKVKQVVELLGRAARLDVGLFFNFDEDYGYDGAHAQKQLDPYNTWSYDLASWQSLFTFSPKIPVQQNRKPILIASGEKDPAFPPEMMQPVAEAIAGPVEYHCMPDATHQLMLFHTERFSQLLEAFTKKHI